MDQFMRNIYFYYLKVQLAMAESVSRSIIINIISKTLQKNYDLHYCHPMDLTRFFVLGYMFFYFKMISALI